MGDDDRMEVSGCAIRFGGFHLDGTNVDGESRVVGVWNDISGRRRGLL
jgi:hypothetical protein